MSRPSRCLEYAGVDAAWEARELRAFSGPQNAIRSAHAVSNYLLGRLLEEDLHVSCKPMLPADIQTVNGSMLQGTCLLQVVDIVNIGANFEHRTEDSKGPTRTLKVCLTDGHQTVFGFEYKWIPALTVKTPRGTKVLVQNVAVRHGMMMLTPETCQVLGASGSDTLDVSRAQSSALMSSDERPSGAYSAALMTVGANLLAHKSTNEEPFVPARTTPPTNTTNKTNLVSPEAATPMLPRAHNLPHTAAELIGSRFITPQPPAAVPAQRHPSNPPPTSTLGATPSTSRLNAFSPPRRKPDTVTPAVFVDISSGDDDTASDATDPMVEHLFYSPNTPRITDTASRNHRPQQPSRKRPHPESSRSKPTPPPATAGQADVVDMTTSPPSHTLDSEPSEQPTFSLLPTLSTPPLTSPFVYFNARTPALSVSPVHTQVGTVLTIRGFMKSVAGFQFNTGVYNLRVLIEDGTATKDVRVAPALVESLMGVSCAEFANAMQSSTPTVAHQLAAKMQVTLMTMQGIMRLRLDAAPDKWTLLQCREYTRSETHALLARVQHHAHEDHQEQKRY